MKEAYKILISVVFSTVFKVLSKVVGFISTAVLFEDQFAEPQNVGHSFDIFSYYISKQT